MTRDGPNAEQVRYWNEAAGPKWVALQAAIDGQIGPIGAVAIDRIGVAAGARVLDVGCGCGDSTLALAARVGPQGSVTGIDLSAPMLARARERAAALGHVRFEQVDAEEHAFAPDSFDVVFSRFGVMFFANPSRAFANLGRALSPSGRVGFVCWQALAANPWAAVPFAAALRHVPPPAAPPDPMAPGPFAFADPERVREVLVAAGLRDVRVEPYETLLTIGGARSVDAAAEFLLQVGPAARALQDADPALRQRVADAVREALAPHATPGGVQLGGAVWIVSALRGAR